MARSGTAERHQAAQASLAAAVVPLVETAWAKLLDPHDLKGSTPKLVAAIRAILHRYGRASAAAGLNYYRLERRIAGVVGRPRLPMPELPTAEEITATVEHVLASVYGQWSPEALAAQSESAGVSAPTEAPVAAPGVAPDAPVAEPGTVTPEDVQRAQDALTSEVEQMILDQSRQAVMGAAEADKAAKGWARVTEPGACSFCLMLAVRGDVYTSKASADFRAHTKQPNGSGGTCRCHAEPVFNAYEPSAEIRKWQKVWEDQIAGKFSGRDARIAFRQAVEGRPVTGPLRDGPKDKARSRKASEGRANPVGDTTSLGFDRLDRTQLEHQLTVLEGLKDSDYKRQQIARVRKRLAQLG